MKNTDKMDVDILNKADQLLENKLTNEILNSLALNKAINMLEKQCREEAQRIIKEAEGEVKEGIDEFRKTCIKELSS